MVENSTRGISVRQTEFRVYVDGYASFWDLVNRGVWEPETYLLFDRYLKPDFSYIDVGAWVGPTLFYAAQKAKHAYGIEPDPVAFRTLEKNLALNPLLAAKITLADVCIAPTEGEVVLGSREDGGDAMSSLLWESGKTRWKIRGERLDAFVRRHQIRNLGFIKMDVEGGEYAIIPSVETFLKQHRPTLFLSMHPAFLRMSLGLADKPFALGYLSLIRQHVRVARSLQFYRYIYNNYGTRMTAANIAFGATRRDLVGFVLSDEQW